MSEFDYEEAYYWWSINDICELIRQYGYTKVLMDIDKALKPVDLDVTISNITGEEQSFNEDEQ